MLGFAMLTSNLPFWLEPVRLHTSGGFSRTEIRRIQELMKTHADELKEAWNAYFNG